MPMRSAMPLLALAMAMTALPACTQLPAKAAQAPQAAQPAWTASWGTALMPAGGKAALVVDAPHGTTLRQAMRLSLGGQALRVRISNLYGAEPLVIGAASVGRLARPGGAQLAGEATPLRFGGADRVAVAPGAEIVSDALPMAVVGGDALALTLFVQSAPVRQSVHLAAHATQFLAPGDQTRASTLEGGRTRTSWYHVAGIEVLPAAAPAAASASVLVAIGDSITDGSGAGQDADERWTDYLVRRLRGTAGPAVGVINAGIGGNRMLKDDNGPHLLSRFERDVLARPGVTHALVLIGVNDLGRLHKGGQENPQTRQAMLAEMQAGWRQLAQQAHARGVCLLAGTLTPYGSSRIYQPLADNEADRQVLNDWLRSADVIDGVADFDAAVRDPAAPDRLQAAFDSGDGLHLSPAGYRAMADAVPLAALTGCRWQAAAASRTR
jgi:lysophospholipase L1-like esterase